MTTRYGIPDWEFTGWSRALGTMMMRLPNDSDRRALRLMALWAVAHLDEITYRDENTDNEISFQDMVLAVWREIPPVGWTAEQVVAVWQYQKQYDDDFDPERFELVLDGQDPTGHITGWIGKPPVGTGASEKRLGLFKIRLDREGEQV